MKYTIRIALLIIALLCVAAWELNLSMVGVLAAAAALQLFIYLNRRHQII